MSEVYKPHHYGINDMYRYFKRMNPGTDITSAAFKATVYAFNKRAVKALLQGKTLNLGCNLSSIRIKKIERNNYSKPSVNWFETNKLKRAGIKKMVYHTDTYYYRWYWNKQSCKIKNKTVYAFEPTNGAGGNNKKLVALIRDDEFAHLNFKM